MTETASSVLAKGSPTSHGTEFGCVVRAHLFLTALQASLHRLFQRQRGAALLMKDASVLSRFHTEH